MQCPVRGAARSEQQRVLHFDRIGWFHVLFCMANSAWIPIFCIGTKVSIALASMPLACMLLALAVIMHQAGLGHSQRDSVWDYVAVDLGFSGLGHRCDRAQPLRGLRGARVHRLSLDAVGMGAGSCVPALLWSRWRSATGCMPFPWRGPYLQQALRTVAPATTTQPSRQLPRRQQRWFSQLASSSLS